MSSRSYALLRGILPTRIFDFVAEQFGVYDSMNHFKGHTKPAAKKTPPRRKTVSKKQEADDSKDVSNAKDEKEPQQAVK